MEITRTAYGTWNGGRYMHFGEALSEEAFAAAIRRAYDRGIRTFMTADVYAMGEADTALGRALEGIPRDTYSLVGIIGHDIYTGKRDGSKGYARFTNAELRGPGEYRDYLMSAAEKQLQRCKASKFDALLLHNPDATGYSSDKVWTAISALKEAKMTDTLGIAPGPANGFALDIILCFERFAELVDSAMIILNPLEPWPGGMVLPAAQKHDVKIITRVVDYGGLFHDDVKPGHQFGYGDHRTFRPAGWVEAGYEKIQRMRPIAQKYGITMLQLASIWNLSQPAVHGVIPTLIQEVGPNSKPIETKIDELAAIGTDPRLMSLKLTPEEVKTILEIGNNKGCMELKGGNPSHTGDSLPDRWSLNPDLEATAKRWGIDPVGDLICSHKAA